MPTLDLQTARDQFDTTIERVVEGGERVILTRQGKPVAVLVPMQEWETIAPDPAWQERFDAVVARIQSHIPPDTTQEEIEADIREACEEVKQERLARRR